LSISTFVWISNLIFQQKMADRRLLVKINDIQLKIKELTLARTSIPCLTIDGFQALADGERDWQSNLNGLFNLNGIHKSWVLDIINSSNTSHPTTVQIQFINNIVRNKSFTLLSQYIIENEIDCLISKEDICASKIIYD
jgi:hypothetical protein